MSFSKNDLETIKSKIQLSNELEKKVKVVKRGNDFWCCCPFHEEKTPSCKINDDIGSYYCFGCGAKGDIFTIYTELYNFSFPDAVKELAQRVGIKISEGNYRHNKENDIIFKILEQATVWFQKNLLDSDDCKQYLKKRSISNNTINDFKIGYSYNPRTSLYEFLKKQNFNDHDILKSNVVKMDNTKKIKDFFYKRLIFPISNEQNKIVGFGGRVLDNSNPKYINSPESHFFKKRSILYNLNQAKKSIRQKKNILICEGYMDVISLHENKISTAVAPLGTALTENQLLLAWKYVSKPTIMFDGDSAGMRASYKSALMSLPFLTPNKYLQFIKLPQDYDPDNFINKVSLKSFVDLLKMPIPIVNFIFEQSSSSIDLSIADNKVTYDKYIDDLIETIKDKKIKYFYKNEFKKLFFDKLKNKNFLIKKNILPNKVGSLIEKQINSFLFAYLNHENIRSELDLIFAETDIFTKDHLNFIKYIQNNDLKSINLPDIDVLDIPSDIRKIFDKIFENSLSELFPYSKKDNDSFKTLNEIKDSIKNLNTRLSNLKKINKSLNEFEENVSSLSWEDLKNISSDLQLLEDNNSS